MPQTVWDKADALIEECRPYLPEEGTTDRIGSFTTENYGDFCFWFQLHDGNRTKIDFPMEGRKLTETLMSVRCDKTVREYTSSQTFISDEPGFRGLTYPEFFYHWKRDSYRPERGILVYFRADFNPKTFVQYRKINAFRTEPCGDKTLCGTLPQNLIGIGEILSHPTQHEIDFEEKAAEILKFSNLEEFLAACKAETQFH